MKFKKVILLMGMILTGPFVLLLCLLLANSVNPMQLAFITRFTVENQSGQDIRITPIGTRGDEGQKGRLPIYPMSLPALPSFRSGDYHLKNSQSITIHYDWDDVNFSEIAVETEDGRFYEFIVDPNPLENQYHRPASDTFIIPEIETLTMARSRIVEVAQEPGYGEIEYILMLLGTVTFLVLLWKTIKGKLKSPKLSDAVVT